MHDLSQLSRIVDVLSRARRDMLIEFTPDGRVAIEFRTKDGQGARAEGIDVVDAFGQVTQTLACELG